MSHQKTNRPTLALIVEGLDDDYETSLFRGCREAAISAGANLICITGFIQRTENYPDYSPLQPEILQRLVSDKAIDGVVFPSMVVSYAGERNRKRFLEAIGKKAAVSLSHCDPAVPFIECDFYGGIRTLTHHMISAHRVSKFAYVEGYPPDHDSQLRWQGFSDALAQAGIALSSVVMVSQQHADWLETLEKDLTNGRPTVEAVICNSETFAEEVVDFYSRHGLSVPYDVRVTGFNGDMGATTIPRITSTTSPIRLHCRAAVELLLHRLRGEPYENRVIIPSDVLVQESCGCRGARLSMGTESLSGNDLNHQTGRAAATPAGGSADAPPTGRSLSLLGATLVESIAARSSDNFLDTLDRAVRQGFDQSRDISYWQQRLILVGNAQCEKTSSAEERLAVEKLVSQGLVFLGILFSRKSTQYEKKQTGKMLGSFSFASNLAATTSLSDMAKVLAPVLMPRFSISNGHVIVLDKSSPSSGRVIIRANQPLPEPDQRDMTVGDYLAEMVSCGEEPRVLICNLLKSWQDPLGVTICEGSIPDLETLLTLRNMVGNQIRMIELVDRIQHQADDLSVANQQLLALRAKEQEYLTIIKRELDLAQQIQRDFLPRKLPNLAGWEMAVYFQPAIEVAGDFYDVFTLPNGRTGIVIADVSGKSVSAAIFMALVRSLLRALSQTTHTADPLSAIAAVNDYIMKNHHSSGGPIMFVTLFYGLLDHETGVLAYINAGHPPPVIAKVGKVRSFLKPTGPAVGIHDQPNYKTATETLLPGETLFAYTDGVTEAQGPAGILMGKETLYKVVETSLLAPSSLIEAVRKAIIVHSGEGSAYDDITMVALRRI